MSGAPPVPARGPEPPQDGGRTLRFVLGNSLDSIADGRQKILEFLEGRAVDESVLNRLDVVFEEIVANIVRHGFAEGAEHALLVEVSDRPGTLALAIEDDGRAFNPLERAAPAAASSIAEVSIGGLGIPLIKAYTRALHYERVPAERRYAPFLDGRRDRNRLSFEIAAA